MRVLIANEPQVYREVLCGTLEKLRPRVEVHAAEPEDLDEEVLRLTPGLVVCSRLTPVVERETPAWIELYPEHSRRANISVAGEKTTFDNVDFDTLLSILDRAERLYESI